jgi:hypothetical protein
MLPGLKGAVLGRLDRIIAYADSIASDSQAQIDIDDDLEALLDITRRWAWQDDGHLAPMTGVAWMKGRHGPGNLHKLLVDLYPTIREILRGGVTAALIGELQSKRAEIGTVVLDRQDDPGHPPIVLKK